MFIDWLPDFKCWLRELIRVYIMNVHVAQAHEELSIVQKWE